MKRLVEITRFLFAGGIAAVVNIAARYVLSHCLPFEVATVIAYLLGMPVAFLLMRRGVFVASGRCAHHEFARFAVVNAISFGVVVGLSALLYRIVLPAMGIEWHAAEIAHVTGVFSAAVTSYVGHKYFSFSKKA